MHGNVVLVCRFTIGSLAYKINFQNAHSGSVNSPIKPSEISGPILDFFFTDFFSFTF